MSEAKFEGTLRAFFIGVRGLKLVGALRANKALLGAGSEPLSHAAESKRPEKHGEQAKDRAFVAWMQLHGSWVMGELDGGARRSEADALSFVGPGVVSDGCLDVLLVRHAFHVCQGSMDWGRFVLEHALDHGATSDTVVRMSSVEQVLLLPLGDIRARADVMKAFCSAAREVLRPKGERLPARVSILTLQRILAAAPMRALFDHGLSILLAREGKLVIITREDARPSYIMCGYERLFSPVAQLSCLRYKRLVLAAHKARSWLAVITARLIVTRWGKYARTQSRGRRQLARLQDQWRRQTFLLLWRRLRRHALEHSAAVVCQSVARIVKPRAILRRHLRRLRLARCVENAWTTFLWRKGKERYRRQQRWAAIVIQSEVRAFLAREHFREAVRQRAQAAAEALAREEEARRQIFAATIMQKHIRRLQARQRYLQHLAERLEWDRFNAEAARLARQAEMERQAAHLEVEELVAARRFEREARSAELLQAASIRGNHKAELLRRRRQQRRDDFEDATRSMVESHRSELLGLSQECDAKEAAALAEAKATWTGVLYEREPADSEDRKVRARWAAATKAWKKRMREIMVTEGIGRPTASHKARDEYLALRLEELQADMQHRRKLQRMALVSKLRVEQERHDTRASLDGEREQAEAAVLIQGLWRVSVARHALRLRFHRFWVKGYDVQSGCDYYLDARDPSGSTVLWAKPPCLGLNELDIPAGAWECHASADGTPWFFEPATHRHQWSPPGGTTLCWRCSASFATCACADGCGPFCSECFTYFHVHEGGDPSHSWEAMDGSKSTEH